MWSRTGTQLLGELCVPTALLISVPGEIFCGVIGQRKEGEKVLFTGWVLQKRRCMASPAAVTSFCHISCGVYQLGEVIVLTLALRPSMLQELKNPRASFPLSNLCWSSGLQTHQLFLPLQQHIKLDPVL